MALQTSNWAQLWEQEALKYANVVENLDPRQRYILETAAEYYQTLVKNGAIVGAKLPHKMKDYEMALAWVVRVGNNEDLLNRMFRYAHGLNNIFNIEHVIYDTDVPVQRGFVEIHDTLDIKRRNITNTLWYEPVVVALYWALNYKGDIKVKSKAATKRRKGTIDLGTKNITCRIICREKEYEAFETIHIHRYKPE